MSDAKWTSDRVLAALRDKLFKSPAHAMLEEVRSHTGFGGRESYADALVFSLHPSRGLWQAGIEIKVTRSDWLRELKQPEKCANIQRFCNYWWVAAPKGVVNPDELPVTWGLIEVNGSKVNKTVKAPKLDPEPLSLSFVASLFRRLEKSAVALEARGFARAMASSTEQQAAAVNATRELHNVTDQRDLAKSDLERTLVTLRRVEAATGIDPAELSDWICHERDESAIAAAASAYRLARVLLADSGALRGVLGHSKSITAAAETLVKQLENS